jgi:L-ascorbate metabolism protein UlaG (beta-lactamase superfamily)
LKRDGAALRSLAATSRQEVTAVKRLIAPLLAAALAVPAVAAEPKGKTEITWYGHSAFVVKTPKGTVLAIDPWLGNPANPDKEAVQKLQKVDYILVTHGHSDHVGEAIALAQRTGAKLVASFDLARILVAAGYQAEQATMATSGNAGGTIGVGSDVLVTLVPAVHSSTFKKDDATPLQPAGNPGGFVINVIEGPTIYHTGDTDVSSDMKLIGDRFKVDLMLACIGGHFTMDPVGAATAVSLVRPKAVIPMHYGTFPVLRGTPAELDKAIKAKGAKARVLVMKPGETLGF